MSASVAKYPNPPIQEAVCELHFDPPLVSDVEGLTTFRSVWADEYPNQKIVEEQHVEFQISQEDVKTERKPKGHRLICRSANGSRLVQLSGTFLAINHLKPYAGWKESFREDILLQASRFLEAAGDRKIRRVGLRYIDKIDIPEAPAVWENWFQFKLPVPPLPDGKTTGFQMQFRNDLPDGRRLVINVVTSPPSSPGTSSVVLDLDATWEGSPVEFPALAEILETVHTPLGSAFEGYLTDKVRQLFRRKDHDE